MSQPSSKHNIESRVDSQARYHVIDRSKFPGTLSCTSLHLYIKGLKLLKLVTRNIAVVGKGAQIVFDSLRKKY